MRQIHLTESAIEEFVDIVAHSRSQWGEYNARQIAAQLDGAVRWLAEHPSNGRKVDRIKNLYAKVVARFPYIIFYEFTDDQLIVRQIIHQARRR
jgi:plasmid stabilization system protein ParE